MAAGVRIGWMVLGAAVLAVAAAALFIVGARRERAEAARLFDALERSARAQGPFRVSLAALGELPAPVLRYFRRSLEDGQPFIASARLLQTGRLRTDTRSDRWLAFTARQQLAPAATGFVWQARIELPLGAHIRVLDSYVESVGSGRVSVLSAIEVAGESGAPELASGALHRYLAEAV